MPRQRRTRVENEPPEIDEEPLAPEPEPEVADVGALIQKERAGPFRPKHPMTEGQANFQTFSQSIIDAQNT